MLPIFLSAADPAGTSFFGWQFVDAPMVVVLPVLLILSAFFSGSETALFGLTESERVSFGDRHPLAHGAVEALLADQRMLLITILLGNMTVNVLYFVITSVLMMHATAGPIVKTIMGIVFLFTLIVCGEVGPKMIASVARERFAAATAPILLTLHRIIGPLRIVVSHGVVGPLSRLTAPSSAPPTLHHAELRALLDLSAQDGVIDKDELRLLHDVLALQQLKVRDVMTPRVNMIALPFDAGRDQVVEAARTYHLRRIPVFDGSLDNVVGLLMVKKYLLDPSIQSITDPRVLTPPEYVPDLVPLDRLLESFRRRQSPIAIVVNEYGGTEGVVAAEDVVEEVVGDIVGPNETPGTPPRLIGLGIWDVPGDHDLAAFAEAFSVDLEDANAASIGVLISQLLGRAPRLGDRVELGPHVLEVSAVERQRVVALLVHANEMTGKAKGEATI